MTVDTKELMKFVSELCKQEGLKVCFAESAKGAAITSGTAFIGGIVGGPIGLTVGGMCGSLLALAYGKGKYKSAVDVVLHEMTPTQHEKLANSIQKFINNLEIEDASYLMPLVMSNIGIKELIVKEILTFFSNEMKLKVDY